MLSACKARKMPPLLPTTFEASLAKLTFLEDADRPFVASLYAKAFAQRLASAEELVYCGLKWGRAEMRQMCKVLESGELVGCRKLDLRGNLFRTWDVREVEAAIEAGVGKSRGFAPKEVLLNDQDPREDPRLCTTHRSVVVTRSSDFRIRAAMPQEMYFCEPSSERKPPDEP